MKAALFPSVPKKRMLRNFERTRRPCQRVMYASRLSAEGQAEVIAAFRRVQEEPACKRNRQGQQVGEVRVPRGFQGFARVRKKTMARQSAPGGFAAAR
jgi:hypothetical protein